MKYFIYLASIVLLITGCGSSSAFKDDTSQPLQAIVKSAVHDAVPNSQLTKTGESFLDFSNEDGKLSISAEPSTNATKDMEKDETLKDTATVIKDLYTDPRVKDIQIIWYTPETDSYGNTSAGVVATVDVSKNTESKINWNGFDSSNIPTIADSFQWGQKFE